MSGASQERVDLGPVGLWTFALEQLPLPELRAALTELDELGYGALWFGEAFGREALTNATTLLTATQRMVIATGIACIYGRDAVTMAQAQRTLAALFPGRFLLGLGLSHPLGVEKVRGQHFGRPVPTMRAYLEAMDAAPLGPTPAAAPRRVLAALGPGMLRLAAARSWGALSYFVPVEHTVQAREIMGSESFLAVEQAVVLHRDLATAAEIAKAHAVAYLGVSHYRDNLCRLGFDVPDDPAQAPPELVNALVVAGDVDTVATRVREHQKAGADHVCVQVLPTASDTPPMAEWRELAKALLEAS